MFVFFLLKSVRLDFLFGLVLTQILQVRFSYLNETGKIFDPNQWDKIFVSLLVCLLCHLIFLFTVLVLLASFFKTFYVFSLPGDRVPGGGLSGSHLLQPGEENVSISK